MKQQEIRAGTLTLAQLHDFYTYNLKIIFCTKDQEKVEQSRHYLESEMLHQVIYGVNTGFGKLAATKIEASHLEDLQRNLVLSHAAGVGNWIESDIVRLILILKINTLAQAYSGVRWIVIEYLEKCLYTDLLPCIPQQGSVGASGDLAPLAHMACLLIGEGMALYQGKPILAAEGLKRIGLAPLKLAPKEGLALINGTQVALAFALVALFRCEKLFQAIICSGSLSTVASQSDLTFLDKRIHQLSHSQGQIDVAATLQYLTTPLSIQSERVQEPYSIRCQPQVMGACLEQARFIARQLELHINAITDNPLIFKEDKAILSGGNFHAQNIAMLSDQLALILATMGNISERRIALLMDATMSGLPAFLVKDSGLHSGFMVAHVTCASLASENKSIAHPSSVDTIPTSANQEDHVSMATFAARRLHALIQNTSYIIATEILAACQGVDLLPKFELSSILKLLHDDLRKRVPFYSEDRYFSKDILEVKQMLDGGAFVITHNNKKMCSFY